MDALDKKLLRDFRRLWLQAFAISLVMACGVAVLLTGLGMSRALDDTRSAYYERNRFADVFATARRAPVSLLPEIRAIEGVTFVEPRIAGSAILDIPGLEKSAVGTILSLPEGRAPLLNVPMLRQGRFPATEATDEVVVNEPFAIANGFLPGDTFHANMNGQKRLLKITGTVLSPEYIYTIGPGSLMPDNQVYGIIWMPEAAVAAAFDMTGAFNNLSLKLYAGAGAEQVIERLDLLLEPYGGLGAFDRSQQQSNAFIEAEMLQLKNMAAVLPPVFFFISAFLVSMVMGRIIALEREEIGLLKAIGYSDVEVCIHYLLLAALVGVMGVVLGWLVGNWLARSLAVLYAEFFDFPFLIYRVSYGAYAISGVAALLSTTAGAAQSALKAARMAPAVAMQPPAPPHFKRTFIDAAMSRLRLSQPTIMILRSFVRWPLRSMLTILGLSLAVASMVAATFFNDALDKIIDVAFYQSNRQDAVLIFADDVPEQTLVAIRRLPGVLQAEGQQSHAVTLRNGPRSKRTAIEARAPDPDLARVIDANGDVLSVPQGGILLSTRLAWLLDVAPGDRLDVEFLTGRQETVSLQVSGIVEQYFGLGAYVDLEFLNAQLRQRPQISMANLSLDESRADELHSAVKELPQLAGVAMMTDARRSFQDTIQENVVIMNTVYITIAVLITVGVAYNGARIQLSERARELASLRILGFTRGEVSYILVGETTVLVLLAQPLGWLLGAWIARIMTEGFESDLYTIPLVLRPATFSTASLVVVLAALVSVLVVNRRLNRLDLVAVMKTRE